MDTDSTSPKTGIASRSIFVGFVVLVVAIAAGLAIFPPGKIRTVAAVNNCYNNLLQLEGAKKQWAKDHQKSPDDVAHLKDLVGSDRYIKITPECPAKGTFSIGSVRELPQCSVPLHHLQYLLARRKYSWTEPHTCADNLQIIAAAKQVLALSGETTLETIQSLVDSEQERLEQRGLNLKRAKLRCPSAGQYSVGPPNQPPRCSVAGHTL